MRCRLYAPLNGAATLIAFFIFLFSGVLTAWGEDRGLLYVVHIVPKTVGIFTPDPESSKMVGTIPVGNVPLNIAISPNGKWLAVSHREPSGETPDVVWIIAGGKKEVVRKIDIYLTRYRERGEIFLLFSNDGEKLYVVDSFTRFLDVIRTSDWRLIKKVTLGIHPQNPLLSRDGRNLYVPNLYSREILIIDVEKDKVVDSVKVQGLPSAVALSRDEKTLYIADAENHRVIFIDTTSRGVIKTVSVGSSPQNIILADGFLYVLNTYSNTLSIIDTRTRENIKNIGIGILPQKMTYDPNGKRLLWCHRIQV